MYMAQPSFFKVFLGFSTLHMSMPPAFVRRHKKKIPKNPTLKTAGGEHSWKLKITKIDGDYCFALGWERVVQDCKLEFGDFLVFWLVDSSTFKVLIFDEDGCEKTPSLSAKSGHALNVNNVIKIDDDGDVGHDDDGDVTHDDGDDDPCFQKIVSEKTHKYTMALPKKFVEMAGIGNQKVVTIKDLQGREWLVKLFSEIYNEKPTYILLAGWFVFREYNDLSDGDVCFFKFVKKEGVILLSKVVKNARNQELRQKETPMVEVKRKRGRPPVKNLCGGGGGGVKIKDEAGYKADVAKRKRGRPPLEKGGSGEVVVKTEYESNKVEEVKRKRGRPPLEKPHGGGGGVVKIEHESSLDVEEVKRKRKRKRGGPPLAKNHGGGGAGGGVEVKIEDDSGSEVEVVKRKRGRPPLEKPSDGGVEVEAANEFAPNLQEVKRNRGRPRLYNFNRSNNVIYF